MGGDEVEVYDIVKPGVDPHDFDPSPADIDALARADVVVTNGIEMEPWLDDALDAAGGDAVVVVAAEGVDVRGDDPHVWHDPTNAVVMVENIAKAFAEDASGYIAEIEALDAEIATAIDALPFGAALAKNAPNRDNGVKLIEFLTTHKAQQVYAEKNYEYPVEPGLEPSETVKSFGELKADTLSLADIAKNRKAASEMVDRVGLDDGPSS